jgi:hypothetical protein
MTMKRLIIIKILSFVAFPGFGQINYPTRDSVHIFWQPDLKLTYSDYKGPAVKELDELLNKYQFSAAASVGVWSKLDIPKKKKDRAKQFEIVYFAPAFKSTSSYTRSNDSLQIEMQNLYFDICELCARWARKELKTLQDSTRAIGTLTIYYMTVRRDMNERKLAMFSAYFKDVFVEKNEGAFAKWRQDIDKLLEETKSWATTPKECYRLMSRKPVEEGYIEAPTVLAELNNEDK